MTIQYKELSAENPKITLSESPSAQSTLKQGQHTDHIVEVDWDMEHGWSTPQIHPWRPLEIDPTSSVIHYATTCFEGMKAYRSKDGKKVLLFRPRENVKRLNDSTTRICLPYLDEEAALKLIELLVKIDNRFITPGHYIYLRPTVFGTDVGLGLKTPTAAKFLVMATGFEQKDARALKLWCSPPSQIRAWPSGFGYAKLGANYGPTFTANREAIKSGYDQVLWLLGDEGYVTEAGGSNFFAVFKKEGEDKVEIVTSPLSTGIILPGITRKSVIQLLKENFDKEAEVVERQFTIGEIENAVNNETLVEAFACGTAYFVSSISQIKTPSGQDLKIPNPGKYTEFAKSYLASIMWGEKDHEWAFIVNTNSKLQG